MKPKFRAAALAASLSFALSGCGSLYSSDVETLLRAPQLSGEGSAVQKALSSYIGTSATLKYPASGDFLSPFLFGDWDGDGVQEAAALYTADSLSANVWLAILEPNGDNWRVSQSVEGLSGAVQHITTAHLKDSDSLQIITSYDSAQGDRYLVVYQYYDDTLQTVIQQAFTHMILTDITAQPDTEDLVMALPTETDDGGVNLQLLTNQEGEFRSTQYLAVGAGNFDGCAALQAGENSGTPYLVVDGWATAGANSLASSIIIYDAETGFLTTKPVEATADFYRATLRYDPNLLSCDIDGNGTIDIPIELSDGGERTETVENRLKFLLWKDYSNARGGRSRFGVYDSDYGYFVPLPESMHGSVLLRANGTGTGWVICNSTGDTVYCEFRVVSAEVSAENYFRIANVGEQQLQVRIVTPYYGVSIDHIVNNTIFI